MGMKFCHEKLASLWYSQRWRFRNPSLHHFDRAAVCDRHTDGRTGAKATAKTRET